MAFMYYQRDKGLLKNTERAFSLAGYNLIYQLWVLNGKPVDQGWQVSADDLIQTHSNGADSHSTAALIVDFDPKSRWRIGLIELLGIYLYTYPGANGKDPGWTPMMLRFRDVMYEEFGRDIDEAEKKSKINMIRDPEDENDFVEFLYLNGLDKGWKWGMNGMTNAVFIQGPARDYFRKYF